MSIHQRKGATFVYLLCWSSYKRNRRDVCMEHGTNKKYSYETNKPGLPLFKKNGEHRAPTQQRLN